LWFGCENSHINEYLDFFEIDDIKKWRTMNYIL